MGHRPFAHAVLFSAAILFSAVTPAVAQDKCRTAEDEAEIGRLEAEIQTLNKQRDQISIDWNAHTVRYNELAKGLPKTQKLVDEAIAVINNDAERYTKTNEQIIKDSDALTVLQSKPCPPKEKAAKGEFAPPPAHAPPPVVTPKPPVEKKCRTPEAEAELKRLKDERSALQFRLMSLKGPIKRAARALQAAAKAAKADPAREPDRKAAEDAFDTVEKQKQDTEHELKSVEYRIDKLNEMAPCPPPEPAKAEPPGKVEPPKKDEPHATDDLEPPKLAPAEVVPPQKTDRPNVPSSGSDQDREKKDRDGKRPLGLGIHLDIGIGVGAHGHTRNDKDHRHDDESEPRQEKPPQDR